jgi:uncharacterized repeat protein (TIGR01451 family)
MLNLVPMARRWILYFLPIALLPALATAVSAQAPFIPPAALAPQVTQLLYVRMTGPEGMRVTFYRGAAQGQTLVAPFTVGLRPGYYYRVKIDGMPQFPAQSFFPTLEVRGSLQAEHKLNPADYPAALTFIADDFRAAAQEGLVTRVVVLERPELALPVATRPDRPVELTVPPNLDPVAEGWSHGRVLLVLRLGQRELSEPELVEQGLRGTILLPGEKGLAEPAMPPWLTWQCVPLLYDPVLGPEPPSKEMCVPDGGDSGIRAGYDIEGRLRGLDPSDTVAEYEDSQGRRRIAVSNQVCVCVPRFLLLRGEVRPLGRFALLGPGGLHNLEGRELIETRLAPLGHEVREQPGSLVSQERPSGAEATSGPVIFGQVEGLDIVGSVRSLGSTQAMCKGPEEEGPPDRPLLLDKWPDKCAALVGDLVTFTLRYRNQGGRPITNVIVSDSLAARYEFVPGSDRSDRAVNFTTQPNEVGSQVLRWQITEPLPPGETGTVTFQVRVR